MSGIQSEDLLFRIAPLETRGEQRLPQFLADGPGRIPPAEPHELHRQRRPSADHLSGQPILPRGACHRRHRHTPMPEKPTILVLDHRPDILLGEFASPGRESPLPIPGHPGPEQRPVASIQNGGIRRIEQPPRQHPRIPADHRSDNDHPTHRPPSVFDVYTYFTHLSYRKFCS